jgi:hypothetical protein
MKDYTIIVIGFNTHELCLVIEIVYVPEAEGAAEAGEIAARVYGLQTGVTVQPLYAAEGRVNLEKLTIDDVFF